MSENAVTLRQDLTPSQDEFLGRLTLLIGQMEARIAEFDRERNAVTILHQDTLAIQRLIRERAGELAAKYALPETAEKKLRGIIKKAALDQYGIRDLHDLPRRCLPACRALITGWSSWSAIRGLRA